MARLDQIANDCALVTTTGSPFSQAISMAGAMQEIRASLTDEVMQKAIMPLMNSKLGFRTDKDPNRPAWNKRTQKMEAPESYKIATVRECLIEATLRGLPPVGNCWNIIASQSYTTKEGLWFLIGKKVPGLTDFKVCVGVPKMIHAAGDARNAADDEAKGALVACYATWKMHGVVDRTDRDIPIRVNAMMGSDAIMGKAERKILAAAYAQITGTVLGEGDVSEGDAELRNVTPQAAEVPQIEVGNPFKEPARRGRPKAEVAPEPAAEPAPVEVTHRQRVTFTNLTKKDGVTEKGKAYSIYTLSYDNGMSDCEATTFSTTLLKPLDGLEFGSEIEIETAPSKKDGMPDNLTFVGRIGGEA